MKYVVFSYEDDKIKLIIKKDSVGYYLFAFKDPKSALPTYDYFFETLDETFEVAEYKFGVSKHQWKPHTP